MQPTRSGTEPASLGEVERAVSLFSGSVLLYQALKGPTRPVLLAPAGWLLLRGLTGQCALKSAGANLASTGTSREIAIKTALTINKTPAQVYAFWRNLENLPLCMRHLQSVTRLDDRTTEWTAAVFDGLAAVSWRAELLDDEPNRRLRWASLPDSPVENRGEVTFTEAGKFGTAVHLQMCYVAPAGAVGETAGRLLNPLLQELVKEDVSNVRRILETGEIPTTSGQSEGAK